jgi:ribonuclease Z
MILTTADVAESAAKNFQQSQSSGQGNNNNNNNKNFGEQKRQGGRPPLKRNGSLISEDGTNGEGMPDLEIVGPVGTRAFLHSLRHFMRRDRFTVHVHEGQFDSSTCGSGASGNIVPKKKAKKKKGNSTSNDDIGFTVKSIPIDYVIQDASKESNQINKQAVSYTFTTPPIPGKFLVEKATELKVPRGPMYAQLKAGKSVTFTDPETNEERTVTPEEVLAEGSGGIGVVVVYCPNLDVLSGLQHSSHLQFGSNDAKKDIELDVVVHLTPKKVFQTDDYQAWCKSFGTNMDHIVLQTSESLEDRVENGGNSPFVSAMHGAIRRSLVNKDLFPMPELVHASDDINPANENCTNCDNLRTIEGSPMMEYVMLPRSRRGVNTDTTKPIYTSKDLSSLEEKVAKSGAAELGEKITTSEMNGKTTNGSEPNNETRDLGELIFTGTGSAVPCKHRNVTGMYLRMHNGNGLLLDTGEGTLGQLLQSWKSTLIPTTKLIDEYRSRIKGIKAVWISHPHADHHLGLLRLLSERQSVCDQDDPIILMAPRNMFAFLSEYQLVVPEIKRSYIAVDCRDMTRGFQDGHPIANRLLSDLGITQCMSVPVAHCPNAFAIVLDGTSFGRVAYSGDCRPSNRFAAAAKGADLLIHEATFEDGMEEEAVLKRHSTVGEAIGISVAMDAKALILTHFSQRYPKIPPLNKKERDVQTLAEVPIAFAFDFLRLKQNSISLASKLTPALRLLYPGDSEVDGDDNEALEDDAVGSVSSAKALMSMPGVFAAKGVL